MNGNRITNDVVKLLVLGGTREFNRSFEDLRAWGYAVTEARTAADAADGEIPAFDLACVEIGPDPDAPLQFAALRRAFPGLAVLGVSALEEDALYRFLAAHGTSYRDFTAILQPPLAFDRLLFAVEEALARQDEAGRALTGSDRQRDLIRKRRSVEAGRLSDFLARNSGRNIFLDFQPIKALKEKKL